MQIFGYLSRIDITGDAKFICKRNFIPFFEKENVMNVIRVLILYYV